MQFKWLEKWAEDGLVSAEAKDKIYANCYRIIKEASPRTPEAYKATAAEVKNSPNGNGMAPYVISKSLLKDRKPLDVKDLLKEDPKKTPDKKLEKVATKIGETAAVHFMLMKLAVDHIRNEEKTAAPMPVPAISGGAMKELMRGPLLMAGLPLLIGAGYGGVRELMERSRQKDLQNNLEASYAKAMSDSKKDERSVLHQDPAAAREAFAALSSFAPHIAVNPLAAKAFMSRIVAYNQGLGLEDIKSMSEIERNMHQATPAPRGFMAGFSEGAGAMGLGGLMQHSVKSTYQPFLNYTSAMIANRGQAPKKETRRGKEG